MTAPSFPEFVWMWNEHQGQTTPRVQLRMARWLAARWTARDHELVLLAFRSSGKSTICGLFCAWLFTKNPMLRILVLAAEHDLACKMVRNVKRLIERHPFTVGLKPRRTSSWAMDQFTILRPGELRDPSMLGRGISANVTGSRADVVLCDDVEVPNTCDTPPKRQDLRDRLSEIPYILVPGGTQLYIGTPHSYYSIYATEPRRELGEEMPFLGNFKRMEMPLLDRRGRSAWPERYGKTEIAKMRRRSGETKFAAQMLLRPSNVTTARLNPDRLRPYDGEVIYGEANRMPVLMLGQTRLVSASCWWDPAFGAAEKGDGSVIAAVFSDAVGNFYLHRLAYLNHDMTALPQVDEATQLCRQAAEFLRGLYLPAVTIETNGIGRFLPGLLRRALVDAQIPTVVVEAHSSKPKTQRILDALDVPLAAGTLYAHRSLWQTPFIQQMREWRPTTAAGSRKRPDDALDAVAGAISSEPVRLTTSFAPRPRRDWRPGATNTAAATDFDP